MNVGDKICIHAVISGKVQGVFFRNGAKQKSEELGLTGWIKNIANGDVELVACGLRDPIMILTEWLWEGSDAAEISNVHWEEIAWEEHDQFVVV